MLTSRKRVGTLLPKGWPRRVRSAVVHAISMSNVVFTVTRSHAENHFNARVRLQAESDRLRREVALLVEEIRIKDARMLRIAPQRRPHYPAVERLASPSSFPGKPRGKDRWSASPSGALPSVIRSLWRSPTEDPL